MSLLEYLLSGASPESETFIYLNVPRFEFINITGKYYKFYSLGFDGLLMFYPANTKTSKSTPIYNIANGEIPTKIKKPFAIQVKKNIKIIWSISIGFNYNNLSKPICISSIFQVDKSSLTNLEVLEYIYKSYKNLKTT